MSIRARAKRVLQAASHAAAWEGMPNGALPRARPSWGRALLTAECSLRAPQLVDEFHGFATHVIGERGMNDALDLRLLDALGRRRLEGHDGLSLDQRLRFRVGVRRMLGAEGAEQVGTLARGRDQELF